MVKDNDKLYIGSSKRGYLSHEMIVVIYDYISKQEYYEYSKAKPMKIGDKYLLEIEINNNTKQLFRELRRMDQVKLYKRTEPWQSIYQMADSKAKAPN
ncbi:MAG: hypothetical protein ACRCX2_11950 [Paraclostridium sp.]